MTRPDPHYQNTELWAEPDSSGPRMTCIQIQTTREMCTDVPFNVFKSPHSWLWECTTERVCWSQRLWADAGTGFSQVDNRHTGEKQFLGLMHTHKHTLHSCPWLYNSWYVWWCVCVCVHEPVSAPALKRAATSNHLWPQLLTFQLSGLDNCNIPVSSEAHRDMRPEEVIWQGQQLRGKSEEAKLRIYAF